MPLHIEQTVDNLSRFHDWWRSWCRSSVYIDNGETGEERSRRKSRWSAASTRATCGEDLEQLRGALFKNLISRLPMRDLKGEEFQRSTLLIVCPCRCSRWRRLLWRCSNKSWRKTITLLGTFTLEGPSIIYTHSVPNYNLFDFFDLWKRKKIKLLKISTICLIRFLTY